MEVSFGKPDVLYIQYNYYKFYYKKLENIVLTSCLIIAGIVIKPKLGNLVYNK